LLFLLHSLTEIGARRKSVPCSPAFAKPAALKSGLRRDILEAPSVLPICGCMVPPRWIGREFLQTNERRIFS